MAAAAAAGVRYGDFLRMLPSELLVYAAAHAERTAAAARAEHNAAVLTAALASRWVWQRRVDAKSHMLGADGAGGGKKAMTDEQMVRAARALNAGRGGEFRHG